MADTIGNTELRQFSYRLCLGVKDTTVYFFDKLVKKAKYNKSTNSEDNNDNQDSSDSVDAVQPLEFTKELYDEALALPEAKSVQLEYSNDATLYQYGKFKGGKTYKNFAGEIDKKSASSAYGWIQLVNFTDEYFIFTSAGSVYIIACKDFSPEPVVLDFMPLYEKLKMWDDSTTEKYKDPVVYSVTDKQLKKDTGKYRIYNFVDESSKINEPWDFPGKNTGVGCHFLLQRILPTQGSNPHLLHCYMDLFSLKTPPWLLSSRRHSDTSVGQGCPASGAEERRQRPLCQREGQSHQGEEQEAAAVSGAVAVGRL